MELCRCVRGEFQASMEKEYEEERRQLSEKVIFGGEWDQLGPCGLFPQLFDIFLGVTGVKILIQNSFCEGKSMLKLSSRALSTHVHPRSTIILCCLLVERTIARFSV